MTIRIRSLTLSNPVIVASGVAGNGEFLREFVDVRTLGAFVTKGITVEPRRGNPPPRLSYSPGGMVNSIGLMNIGVEAFLKDRWPALRAWGIPIIANLYGFSMDEYPALAGRLEAAVELVALEINLSCPNVEGGGREVGDDPARAANLIARVRGKSSKPLIAKLAPGGAGLPDVSKALAAAGADAICIGNTLRVHPVSPATGEPLLGNGFGGFSGPALKPIVLRHLNEIRKAVDLPLIAAGGVRNVRDARDYLRAGACAVEIGTANLFNPRVAAQIAARL